MSIIPRSPAEKHRTGIRTETAHSRLHLFTQAVTYLERGWPVIPVRDKVPLTQWRKYQHMLPTDAQVMAWLAEEPAPDLAIVTGTLSGLLVLDVDGPEGEASIRGLHLPPTPTARTPRGGRHVFFRHPGGRIRSTVNLLPKVDIRADGGYVVAPPAPGREWVDFLSPEDVDLAAPPAWLLAKLSTVSETGGARGDGVSHVHPSGGTSNYIVTRPTPDREKRERQREAVKTRAAGPEPLHALKGRTLLEWYNRTDVGIAVAAHLGLPTGGLVKHGRGKPFRCVLHDDTRPSASLYVHPETGGVLYRCWHRGGDHYEGDKGYYGLPYLAALMARQADDTDRPPAGPEVATWGLRLLVETGHVAPARVEACPLPDDAPSSVREVYRGFLLLLATKWLHSPGEATTFSWRFAAGWCGVPKSTVERAMKRLLEMGYVRRVSEVKAAYGRRMGLFLPGTPKKGGDPGE